VPSAAVARCFGELASARKGFPRRRWWRGNSNMCPDQRQFSEMQKNEVHKHPLAPLGPRLAPAFPAVACSGDGWCEAPHSRREQRSPAAVTRRCFCVDKNPIYAVHNVRPVRTRSAPRRPRRGRTGTSPHSDRTSAAFCVCSRMPSWGYRTVAARCKGTQAHTDFSLGTVRQSTGGARAGTQPRPPARYTAAEWRTSCSPRARAVAPRGLAARPAQTEEPQC
jgi:hypothetical protein